MKILAQYVFACLVTLSLVTCGGEEPEAAPPLTPSEPPRASIDKWEQSYPEAAREFYEYMEQYVDNPAPSVTRMDVFQAYEDWMQKYPEAEAEKERALARDGAAFMEIYAPEEVAALRELDRKYPERTRALHAMLIPNSPASMNLAKEWARRPENAEFSREYAEVTNMPYLKRAPIGTACYLLWESYCDDNSGTQ